MGGGYDRKGNIICTSLASSIGRKKKKEKSYPQKKKKKKVARICAQSPPPLSKKEEGGFRCSDGTMMDKAKPNHRGKKTSLFLLWAQQKEKKEGGKRKLHNPHLSCPYGWDKRMRTNGFWDVGEFLLSRNSHSTQGGEKKKKKGKWGFLP